MDADAIVVGGGLAGLVADTRADRGRRARSSCSTRRASSRWAGRRSGRSAGCSSSTSPEQRRMRIRDSRDLALQDWLGSAGFDREEDTGRASGPRPTSTFAAGEKRAWLHATGVRWFPIVGWAERGGYTATEHGNSVPRFHVTWGTGPGHHRAVRGARARGRQAGLVSLRFRHRVNALTSTARRRRRRARRRPGADERASAATPSSRNVSRRVRAQGAGDHRHLRRHRRQPRSRAPELAEAARHAARAHDLRRARSRRRSHARHHRGRRRQHHQPRPHVALHRGHPELEPDLDQARHPHPARSVLAVARRARAAPAGAAVPRLRHAGHARAHHAARGYDYSWFVLSQKIIEREFALSGSEQNPDLTSGSWAQGDPRAQQAAARRHRCAPSWRRAPTSSSSAT